MNTLPAFEEYGSKRGGRNVAPALQILQLANYQRLERRCCWKQSSQYTGLSPRGRNGTLASFPQFAQVTLCISRSPPKLLRPPPPLLRRPPPCLRACRQDGQRVGSLVNPFCA